MTLYLPAHMESSLRALDASGAHGLLVGSDIRRKDAHGLAGLGFARVSGLVAHATPQGSAHVLRGVR